MIIRKAFKFKLKMDRNLEDKFFTFAGHSRFVWNKVLMLNLERLEKKQKILWYQESAFWLKIWKSSEDYGFLKECHSQVLQQKLKDLEKAFKDGFDKKQPLKRLPKRRKKGLHDSFRYNQGFKIEGKRLYLPKIGWVSFFKSQDMKGTPKNITISRQGDGWFASIQVEYEKQIPVHSKMGHELGIDLGVKSFVTTSDGEMYVTQDITRKYASHLKREQRSLSRKKRFSENWKKQQVKIRRIHKKILNCRHDNLHKLSTQLSQSHARLYREDLKIKNMTKSAKGDIEASGKNVKAKSGLSKSILDKGWGEFNRQLDYKMLWNGGEIVTIDPKYTSQRCSFCSHVQKENRLSQSAFRCIECGYEDNADINAAKNILALGRRVSACGNIGLIRGLAQEPLAA